MTQRNGRKVYIRREAWGMGQAEFLLSGLVGVVAVSSLIRHPRL